MESEVKHLELVFENVESIVLPWERVTIVDADAFIPEENDPFGRDNVFSTSKLHMVIAFEDASELIYDAEKESGPLGMFAKNTVSNHVEDRPHILGRIINHHDMVCLDFLD